MVSMRVDVPWDGDGQQRSSRFSCAKLERMNKRHHLVAAMQEHERPVNEHGGLGHGGEGVWLGPGVRARCGEVRWLEICSQ